MTRVAIVGPGAIGGTLAAFFKKAGMDVELVGRRSGRIRVSGGPFRDLTIRAADRASASPDVVFFCVKSGDTLAAISGARRWIGPASVVASLQNGLRHRRPLLSAFGRRRTVFGVCVIGAERAEPGRIVYHGGRGIGIGRRAENIDAAARVESLLRRARLDVWTDPAEDKLLWSKAAFNTATNPLGALTAKTNGELVEVPALRELALRALKEACAASKAAGNAIHYDHLKDRMISGLRSMPRQPNSMLQDLRAGRRTEIEAIVKPLLNAARKKRVETPTLDSLYRFIRRLESRR